MRLTSLLSALSDGLAPIEWHRTGASDDPVIRGLTYDSRSVAPGDLFVALRGAVSDGHDYLEQATTLGAAALLVERAPDGLPHPDRSWIIVPDTRRALALLAARFYGDPATECTLIGVTGTNGKTSTTYLVESILARAGLRTGLIGTVEIRYAAERLAAVNTTPESLDLQRLLRSMLTLGIEAVVMEVSSHGLELGRVTGCSFRVGAFTNLTQDHLDFHGSMDAYLVSKARLFREHLSPGGAAVINVDDPAGEKLVAIAQSVGATLWRCTRDPERDAELRLLAADATLEGTRATVDWPEHGPLELDLPLLGDFNLENLLVACGVAAALGIEPSTVAEGTASCPQVPGRMERVEPGGSGPVAEAPTILVDYAHTPDAVEKLLQAVRPLTRGDLVAVFGCGGDRDKAKRPLMAAAVARSADRAIATSDNPRTEDANEILRDVEAGLTAMSRIEPDSFGGARGGYCVLPDRREAIALAIASANPDDTVVIAGKGHEDYQIIGRKKLPFDDRVEARRALGARSSP